MLSEDSDNLLLMRKTASQTLFVSVSVCFCTAAACRMSAAAHDYVVTYTDLTPPSAMDGSLRFTSGNQQGGVVNGFATVWNGPSHSMVNLHPAGATYSGVMAGAGNQQAGYTYTSFPQAHYATIWNGTASSFQNLNPSWSSSSMVLATTGTRQAGYATGPGYQVRAGVWSGSASSFVDLHPASGISSTAYAIAGDQQGGMVNHNGFAQAALWSGTAASYRNLHPAGQLQDSRILGMTTSQQVGYAGAHAGIWFGTAESFVNLHPADASFSEAHATIDTMQAGFATFGPYRHALLWFGSADDYIDLQFALGSRYRQSEARSIWTDGSTILVAGTAVDWPGYSHPVLWRLAVPEPGTGLLLAVALGVLAVVKRRRQRWTRCSACKPKPPPSRTPCSPPF